MHIPDFVEIQRKSFCELLEKGLIKEITRRIPITNSTNDLELIFYPEYYQLNPPEWTSKQAILKAKTYACRLYVPAQLINHQTKQIKIQWVLLANLPIMTKRGHFIINGSPRVIINQMVRSPGIYYQALVDKNKKRTYYADLISTRGAWLRLETDKKKRIWARMKKTPKISILVFLQAMGLSQQTIFQSIQYSDFLKYSFLKENHPISSQQALITLYSKTHPKKEKSELTSEIGRKFLFRKFLNPRTYDLGSLGRIRLNKKLGLSIPENQSTLTPQDILYATDYLIKLEYSFGELDDIDHLKNRRVRASGEIIQNQLGTGLIRLEKLIREKMKKPKKHITIRSLITTKPINGALREFFGSSQLSQFMDQTNPLAEITHKRRLSSLGPGGVSRETAGMAVRGIHPTHYGRICPIETPEGQNAGLVNSITTFARVNSNGFLETPLYKVYKGQVQKQNGAFFFSAEQEENIHVAPGDLKISKLNFLPKNLVPIRYSSEFKRVSREKVEYISISPIQMISIATSLIPFLEHDDANRALMGSNMQRQAVPLMAPQRPIVGTGLEARVVSDSGHIIQSSTSGYVSYVSGEKIVIKTFPVFCEKKQLKIALKKNFINKNQFLMVDKENTGNYLENKKQLVFPLNDFLPFKRKKINSVVYVSTRNFLKKSLFLSLIDSIKHKKNFKKYKFINKFTKNIKISSKDINTELKEKNLLVHPETYKLLQNNLRIKLQNDFSFIKLKNNLKKDYFLFNGVEKNNKFFIPSYILNKNSLINKKQLLKIVFKRSNLLQQNKEKIFPILDLKIKRSSTFRNKSLSELPSTKLKVEFNNIEKQKSKLIFNENSFLNLKSSSSLMVSSYGALNTKQFLPVTKVDGVFSVPLSKYGSKLGFQNTKQNNLNYFEIEYKLQNYHRSNQDTCITQRPVVKKGDWVEKGDVLADGSASVGGELALGKNILIAYMPWEGYNFEDAILISDRLVYEDIFTSIHIERYEIEIRDTKFGVEQITNQIPEIDANELSHLDQNGIAKPGTWVKEGDILVGKVTPISKKPLSPHEKLLYDIVGKDIPTTRDSSLRIPKGVKGRVIDVQILETENIPPETSFEGPGRVHIYVAEKRKIQVGDKMAGRHGNKGIVSKILPRQDMPYLPDGTPIDMVLNPLGVPSRMNVGQVFECLLGLAGVYLDEQYKINLFDEVFGPEASRSLVYSKLFSARLKTSQEWLFNPEFPGKTRVFDGRTGESFHQPVTVGKAYMLKLVHLVDEKIHARSTGPYSLVTQQPLRGRSKHGGQRLGEMEVWAVEGFGAAYTLQELLTVKSDDLKGRHQVMDAILNNEPISLGTPESFKVLIRELQSLCLDVGVYGIDSSGIRKQIDVLKLA